ncbi:MAG: hypothetical protein LBI62_06310 [Candidatus Accumulibacter sp.]|jgi:hypothetical protein|nr:hypothetical protein [Accumulibacter sp.]
MREITSNSEDERRGFSPPGPGIDQPIRHFSDGSARDGIGWFRPAHPSLKAMGFEDSRHWSNGATGRHGLSMGGMVFRDQGSGIRDQKFMGASRRGRR